MSAFNNLEYNHPLFLMAIKDGQELLSKVGDRKAIKYWLENPLSNEYEYYVRNVIFFLSHLLKWCKQLDLAVELLSNYSYSKKNNSSRIEHLMYGMENYWIRLNSVFDRVLQAVNAVFYLGINQEHVGYQVVVSNDKIKRIRSVQAAIKQIYDVLKPCSQYRHSLIHRHSCHNDKELEMIEFFYFFGRPSDLCEVEEKDFKILRSTYLRKYVNKKKDEFLALNHKLAELLSALFDLLKKEYEKQKLRLK